MDSDDTFFRNTAYQTSASEFHVYLTPPNFSSSNVIKTLAGVRPQHSVAPELSFEVRNNKNNKPVVLVHNYVCKLLNLYICQSYSIFQGTWWKWMDICSSLFIFELFCNIRFYNY